MAARETKERAQLLGRREIVERWLGAKPMARAVTLVLGHCLNSIVIYHQFPAMSENLLV